MKTINTFILFLSLVIVCIFFSQCSTTKCNIEITKTILLDKKMKQQLYYQHWIAGIKGGGSGINVVISKNTLGYIKPLQVYFRNKITTVDEKQFDYIAHFKSSVNQLEVPNNDNGISTKKDHNKSVKNFPFVLEDNEVVIQYKIDTEIKYIKFSNLIEKEKLAYPSAPKQR